jgi:murein L,D-transpeptidase YafK
VRLVFAFSFALALAGAGVARADCPSVGARVVVDTSARELSLCEGGHATHRYTVALGRGGLDKKREGDGRTPLGEYPLAAPRASAQFHTFLAVGYPTAEQRKAGLTGGAVGVHGPGRSFRLLGPLVTATDWTAGCIAVASDAQIDEIAGWVHDHGVRLIEIQ